MKHAALIAGIFAALYFALREIGRPALDFTGWPDSQPLRPGNWTTIFEEPAVSSKIQAAARAIFDFEDPNRNAVASRNNNPGNLKFAGQREATGQDARGFAIFPSLDAGFRALEAQLALDARRSPNMTLAQFFSKYLGGDGTAVKNAEGDSINYAAFVAKKIGAGINDTLGKLFFGGE